MHKQGRKMRNRSYPGGFAPAIGTQEGSLIIADITAP